MAASRKSWRFTTKSVHVGSEADRETGAVSPPIHWTSTYKQDAVGRDRGYDYSRAVNPTRERLEANVAALEGGRAGLAFSSGMAAATALFQTFSSGDHSIISRNTYGGTYRVARQILERHGLEFDFIDTRDLHLVEAALRPNTRMIFVETPTNPLLELVDLAALGALARRKELLLVVDNTFMSPYGQRPLEFGAQAVLHSSTKFLGGHSDVLGGLIVTADPGLGERLRFIQKSAGAVPSPLDCWLLLRSVKTLALRFQRQSATALKLARWLEGQSSLERVIYPGLKSHPQHQLASRQQRTPGGTPIYGSMISIDLGSVAVRDRFLERTELFTLAESLGGVESLISNPFSMTHDDVPEKEKLAMGITEGLLRLSVGIEDLEDLKADLKRALA